jgi:hypothetical protein
MVHAAVRGCLRSQEGNSGREKEGEGVGAEDGGFTNELKGGRKQDADGQNRKIDSYIDFSRLIWGS